MEALTALVARLLGALSGRTAGAVCPGPWPWAVSLLGVGVGLLPVAGAVAVAVWRRRLAVPYPPVAAVGLGGIGVLSAGLAPLLVFTATGRVFAAAADGRVAGLTARQQRSVDATVCLVGPQSRYLGGTTVSDALGTTGPVRLGLAVLALVAVPLTAALFTLIFARRAVRGGPRWPARLFWLPLLAVAVLTGPTPAGTAAHLWLGVAAGTFLGIFVVAAVGAVAPAAPRPHPVRAPARAPTVPPMTAAPRTPTAPVTPAATPVRTPTGPPRFRLRDRLGSGGFGGVWLAEDAHLRTTVAVKAAHVRDADTEERIRREARALAAVHHPHCVRILGLVRAEDDPGLATLEGLVIVMEYVRGESLGERVRARGTVDDVTAAKVWSSIAGALDAAHRRGVLHRDVKPGNVVVDRQGQAHLIDFGIARQTGDATMTAAGFVLGTPDFLAPEVAAGGTATAQSDAWQLAATVAYALSGHPPRGDHPDALAGLRAAALGGPPTHLPTRSAHLDLLRAALDADPACRPSLAAVTRALDTWLRSAGVRPDSPVAPPPAARGAGLR